MGKVVFEDPVDYISGKISKKKQTVFNRRKASDRRYTQVRGERNGEPTAAELAQRRRFSTIVRSVNQRMMNVEALAVDRAGWRRALKAGDSHTTLHGWLVAQGFSRYDAASDTVTWPASW